MKVDNSLPFTTVKFKKNKFGNDLLNTTCNTDKLNITFNCITLNLKYYLTQWSHILITFSAVPQSL
jgi:hypothetical protein